MGNWLPFITSLPTENAILRQRAWRALKASGTAMQRGGVYLMPERESCRAPLKRLQINVREGGGKTLVLRIEELEDANFIALFDRSADYAALLSEVAQIRESLRPESVQEIIKQAHKLRRAFATIVEIDFFLDVAQRQAESALQYCTLPRTCTGNAATPLDRPVGQRLADPPLHRPIRSDSLDQESCRLPARSI